MFVCIAHEIQNHFFFLLSSHLISFLFPPKSNNAFHSSFDHSLYYRRTHHTFLCSSVSVCAFLLSMYCICKPKTIDIPSFPFPLSLSLSVSTKSFQPQQNGAPSQFFRLVSQLLPTQFIANFFSSPNLANSMLNFFVW